MLKHKYGTTEYSFHKKALRLSMVIGLVFSILTALNGHATTQHLYREQPEKLAAAEGLFETKVMQVLFSSESPILMKEGLSMELSFQECLVFFQAIVLIRL